jgi:hypothetical protein
LARACSAFLAPEMTTEIASFIRIHLQGELSHCRSFRNERPHLLDRVQACFVRDARESLPNVERFAMAVELTMVACVKLAVGLEFSGQETARKRHPRNDGDLTLLRLRQKTGHPAADEKYCR